MARAADRPRSANFRNALALAGLNLRRFRSEAGMGPVLLVVVFATTFAAVAVPQLFNAMSDDALRESLTDAAAINRNISAERAGNIPPGGSGEEFSQVDADGREFRGNLAEPLQRIIDEQQYVVESPQFSVGALPGSPTAPYPRFLRFRYQEDVPDHVEVVRGREPQPADAVEVMPEPGSEPEALPLYEIAISQETADWLELDIGDRALLTPDEDDALNRGIPLRELDYRVVLEVVGIIESPDPDHPYWFSDPRLLEPLIVENPDFIIVYATGLMSPADYPRMLVDTEPSRWGYSWRYFVAPEQINAGDADTIADEIRTLQIEYGTSGIFRGTDTAVRTGLIRIIESFQGQRQLTISMLSLVSVGLLIVAFAVIGLLAALNADRRRDAIKLARSRGGTAGQLGWGQAAEGLVLALPATFLAYLLATSTVPGRTEGVSVLVFILIAFAVAGLLVIALLPLLRRDLGELLSERDLTQGSSPRRVVLELAIAAAAIGGLLLFRRRGLDAGSLSNPDQGFDPLLAAVPALLGLAAGILTLRLYPFPIRLLSWAGSLRRGLLGFVGFRRVAGQHPAARLPIVVISLAVAIAVFTAVLSYSIREGQQNSTWHEVGADYRIESLRDDAPLSRLIDLSSVEEIEATADAVLLPQIRMSQIAPTSRQMTILAIETEAYQAVTDGTRAEPAFPEAMLGDQDIRDIGTPSNPIPVIVSSTWVEQAAPGAGDSFTVAIGDVDVTFIIRDVRNRFPGLEYGQPFAVTSLESLRSVEEVGRLPATRRYLRAPDEAADEIRQTLRQQSLGADVISRARLYEDLAAAPLAEGVTTGFRLALVMASLYAALAAVTAIALTSGDRSRDIGYLRTLGLSTAQAMWLTVIEQAPPALVAAGVGTALGILLVRLVEPGINVEVFAGESLPAEVVVNWQDVVLIVGGLLAVVFAVVAVYSYLTRRMNLGSVLRLGDE